MDFRTIKLIIWDLDETLWKGTISDGDVVLPEENKNLIINSTDCGVINSICSKNDVEPVKNKLNKEGVYDYFVFNSINWSPKGERVNQIISEMNLRPVNVLFVDDNPLNREEASSFNKGIATADTDIIPELISYFENAEKRDKNHDRLGQYKVLEKKKEFRALAGSNTEFLVQSNIQVQIHEDCLEHLDRITDLVARSNQLNFTKIRSTREELEELFHNPNVHCGYVTVVDNYGDYGIVGFYALKDNKLMHYVFSCRTLGMGVEQYVYKTLNKPELIVTGEVSADVNSPDPFWVNSTCSKQNSSKSTISNGKIVLKGLCDMQQMFAYIAENDNIITEFEYVNKNGVSIEQRNHSSHVVQALTISKEERDELTKLPFGDKEMYTTHIYDKDINFIVYSLFTDPNMGLYRKKDTGTILAFGEYTNNITNPAIWDKLIAKELFVANCNFTKESLADFASKFEFIGRISQEEIVQNLATIYSHIQPESHLVLVLGSEKEYPNEDKPAYLDRHLYNHKLNKAVKEWAIDKDRVILMDMNEIATEDSDYTNNINHFTRRIYFEMSNRLIQIIEKNGGKAMKQNGEFIANLTHLKRKITKAVNLFISIFNKHHQ